MLPRSYTIHETDNTQVCLSNRGFSWSPPSTIFKAIAEELKHKPTTVWGCYITIPLKEKAVQIVDKLTPEALEIGVINTSIRAESGHLIGDNAGI
jgi:shikimate 5-dehydrogenase